MTPRRSAPPPWFLLCVAVVLALAMRALPPPGTPDGPGGGHPPQVQLAFWGFFILIAELIWKGVEVAGKVTLAILHWMVVNLSLIVTKIGNGLKTVGAGLLVGLKKAWEFFRLTYDKVLKPAVLKFWKLYDKFRKWLDDTFGPVLKHLRDLRDSILCFYKTWVRPWLDLIDVTRRALRVLASMGLKWARALDAKLGALEDKIERPFRYVLAKVNEVINLVNRVVTLDGLLQRAALIRSLARDYKYAWQAIANPYSKPIAGADRALPTVEYVDGLPDVVPGVKRYLQDGTGPEADIVRAEVRRFRAHAVQR